MEPRKPASPPPILPVKDEVARPLFSVMIPSYNCINYLRATIESVLAQDPGPEKMQIEVVDDCSTDGDVQDLVNSVGKGRVGYFRHATNRGALRTFETCINRSNGHFVHILHGDDKVEKGFYNEIFSLFEQYPEAGAAFTRHALIDSEGNEFSKGKKLSDQKGILQNWLYQIAQMNKLQTPSIVVKRSVYEHLGAFFAVDFGEDWEMWVRIASKYPVAYTPECLALYRVHTNNLTSRNFLSGQNIKDINIVIKTIQSYLPEEHRKILNRKAKENCSRYIASTAHTLLSTYNEPKAAWLQLRSALKLHLDARTLYLAATFMGKFLIYAFQAKGTIRQSSHDENTLLSS